jgi:hypothetical protein
MGVNPPSDAPTTGSPPVLCGSTAADVSGIIAAKGIAIDNTGTIYFTRQTSNRAYIGRLRRGQAIEPTWYQAEGNNADLRTMRVDNYRELLHVADVGYGNLVSVGFTRVPPDTRNSAGGLTGIHGVTVADDGAVFTSTSDGHITRVVVDLVPARNVATTAPVFPAGQRPMGMAFGPGGYLYVGSSNGRIKRFRVVNKMLVEGVDHGEYSGPASDLAFDVQGRIYVAEGGTTARPVSVVPPVGTVSTVGPSGLFWGLAFGRGVLSCQQLYASDSVAAVQVIPTTALGLDLP